MKRELLMILAPLLALGCNKPSESTPAPTAPPTPEPTAVDVKVDVRPELEKSKQLIVGITDDFDDANAVLYRFERTVTGWQLIGDSFAATTGRTGLAWGVGMHGVHAPNVDAKPLAGPIKREGDGKSPAGIFAIGEAFGYDASAPQGTTTPYSRLDKDWVCVDDASSRHYNRVFKPGANDKDFGSHEKMRRDDILYKWVILIDHNGQLGSRKPTPSGGSCIFFHVWRDVGKPTVGCVAMPQPRIETLLSWLDPAAVPAFALLPADQYRILRHQFGLPKLPNEKKD